MNDTNVRKETSIGMGYLLLFLSGVLWGTEGFFVTKMSQMGADALLTAFTGQFFAIAPLLIYILISKGVNGLKISKVGFGYSILLGVFTKALFKVGYNSSIVYSGVATSGVLVATATIWVAVLSVIIFKEKLFKNDYIGIAMNIIGVVLVVTLGDFSSIQGEPIGIFLGLLAGFLHSWSTILSKLAATGDDPLTTTFYTLLISSITLTFIAQPWTPDNMALFYDRTFLIYAIILGVFTGAIANLFYFQAMAADIDASKAPVINSVNVIVGAIIGILAFSERMNIIGILGFVLIFLSIYIMNKVAKPEPIIDEKEL